MVAEVIKFGEPENESERAAIQYLRGHLPDTYRLYTNVELARNRQLYEVDIVLVAPHAVYIIDVKGVYGRVEVDYAYWYPENRSSYPSPLKKYRQHARAFSGLLSDAQPRSRSALKRVWIQGAVLLTTEDVEVVDVSPDYSQVKDIVRLNKAGIKYFMDWQSIDGNRFETKISPVLRNSIDLAIKGRGRARKDAKRFRDWEIIETLGEQENRYTEYRAKKTFGSTNRLARLRVYTVDPWLDKTERQEAYHLISTAFQAVYNLPNHDNILKVQDIFESSEADNIVLVIEEVKGQSLRHLLRNKELTLEKKLSIIRDVLRGLEHAHKHGVIHRNISPDNVFITAEAQAKLAEFDYARIENRTGTIAELIVDELEGSTVYQDFDCQRNPSQASKKSDLFSVGQVFYELLTGQPAFNDTESLVESSGIFPTQPSQTHPDLPEGFDSWLQKLCAFDRNDRFASGQNAFDAMISLSKVTPDLSNLPTGTPLNGVYEVVEKLGKPGSFAVAYKVAFSYDDDFQVIKIVLRDRYSLFERARQEFKLLRNVLKNPHPRIVRVQWAGELTDYDNTPFIVFEYIDGKDLEETLESKDLSLEQGVQIFRQTAEGLAYLHEHEIYHQDIKPSNLLLTEQGVKIIDFNVSVTSSDESAITAGTRRYLPPGFKPSVQPSKEERIDRDLYALGVTAYECILGHHPSDAAQNTDTKQLCAAQIVGILNRAIAPQYTDRFQSAKELLEALDNIETQDDSLTTKEVIQKSRTQPETIPKGEKSTPAPVDHSHPQPELSLVKPLEEIADPLHVSSQNRKDVSLESVLAITTEGVSLQPSNKQIDLFSIPPTDKQAVPSLEKPIVLDPSKAYPVPAGYIPITTEMEWISRFDTSNGAPYWIRGKFLCDWTEEWLHCWNQSHLVASVKLVPKERLSTLIQPIEIPTNWTDKQCLSVVIHLDKYDDNALEHLLADVTDSDIQSWLQAPSVSNLARWLTIEVSEDIKVLEQVWQHRRKKSFLGTYYQTKEKSQLLRRWLKIAEPHFTELGSYPLEVPLYLQKEFDTFWEKELYRTDGGAVDAINWNTQPEPKRIAEKIYEVFRQNPSYITSTREKKICSYISHQQYKELTKNQRPHKVEPLSKEATANEALTWATEAYLPLRRWETVVSNLPAEQRICDQLATSFEGWLLEHYPELKVDSVASSLLNYNVGYQVQELCKEGPVLWVVVDGLGWLDHKELLANIAEHQKLQLEHMLRPKFSILPTKTEYAKWSLYSQHLPSHETWKGEAGKGFSTPKGKRYTDNDVNKQRLQKDLKQGQHRIYCWDTDRFDSLFHREVDWSQLYAVKRQRELRDIADDILRFVELHPQKEQVSVVIASDHGQLMGVSTTLANLPQNLEFKGRMAIGRSDDPRMAVLDKGRFDLPHDISVVRGPQSFNSFSYADDKSITGCHGGLYPEEVVIGFSVLRYKVKRAPVIVSCAGSGTCGETEELKIEINNPNALPLEDVVLFVDQINSLKSGKSIDITIGPNRHQTITVSVSSWPEILFASKDKMLWLTGRLEFRYQDAEHSIVQLENKSVIEVNQVFSSGMQGGIDDFL